MMRARIAILSVALALSVLWAVSGGGLEPLIVALTISLPLFGLEVAPFMTMVVNRRSMHIENPDPVSKAWRHLRYSFLRDEFINPGIIEELKGLISDPGSPTVAIDLVQGNRSNRFFCDISVDHSGQFPTVSYSRDGEFFSYTYVGTSDSGIHMLHTVENGGGSGVFHGIAFVTLSSGASVEYGNGALSMSDRVVITIIGYIGLGDRYNGAVAYRKGKLTIGVDKQQLPDRVITAPITLRLK
ncbi:MAG: hypothetical protein IPO20_04495 [Gammaproteobacteria bacterium]|nr:hypothetical protein [Gammaproteobacteria bacterium]MBP7908434.1 hypothetical protein [Pseudomonadales bacterium]